VTFAIDLLSGILLVSGAALVLLGTIGILRLPDALTQIHAAGITDTLGVALVILGLIVKAGFSLLALKLLIVLLLLVFTNPTASHSLARAVVSYRRQPWRREQEDDS
jgi:multicomponent Na+:H+ antiporter subunit G